MLSTCMSHNLECFLIGIAFLAQAHCLGLRFEDLLHERHNQHEIA